MESILSIIRKSADGVHVLMPFRERRSSGVWPMADITKRKMFIEWMILALCLGVGGHVALGVLLHAPGLWPKEQFWLLGILAGISVYVFVQVSRSLWWLVRGERHLESLQENGE